MADYVLAQGFSPWFVLIIILTFYLVFGCVMDSLSMILLTVPIFFPVISAMDFDLSPEHVAIWFGILVLIVVEVGLITPPVGMNLFIINAMDRETKITETYKAVMFLLGQILYGSRFWLLSCNHTVPDPLKVRQIDAVNCTTYGSKLRY